MDRRLLAQFSGEKGEYYLLQELVNQKLMAMDAKGTDLLESEEFKFEFESMKDNFISQYVINTLLENVEVTEEEVKKYYEENEDKFREGQRVKASHILVDNLDKANELYENIKNGDDFADVARKYSTCPSSRNGGDLGFFGRGQMVKEFEEKSFSMNVGDISEPVKTQFGYHLIHLTDKESKKEFEDIKEELMQTLLAQKQQEAYVNKINELRKKYNVK
jgi:peptidyl-prolyl cis-trans isomerase